MQCTQMNISKLLIWQLGVHLWKSLHERITNIKGCTVYITGIDKTKYLADASRVIVPCSVVVESGNIGTGPVCLSIHLSILTHFSMMAGWAFFIFGTMVRYHGLLMHITYNLALCKIRVIMTIFPYIWSVCCYLWEECGDCVHIW